MAPAECTNRADHSRFDLEGYVARRHATHRAEGDAGRPIGIIAVG